jgi:hypothetical protein
MNILDRIKDVFRPKDPASRAERGYKKGLRLTRQRHFHRAIPILEEAATLNPVSAPIHQVLGFSYSQVAGEYEGDEVAMNSWMGKAADTFWKAITLHREHGGLEEKQLSTAIEIVSAFDRIQMQRSNVPAKDQRMKAYAAYRSRDASGLDFAGALHSFFNGRNLQASISDAESRMLTEVADKFKISERQMSAIIQEGESNGW